jgi:putative uncharacterized protein (hiran domain family)
VSRQGNRDYIYLVWQDPVSRRKFIVGELSKSEDYEFQYGKEIDEAREQGFELLDSFPRRNKVYSQKNMFGAFSSRLPDSKRSDIKNILASYGLQNFDEYELLKKSGARLPIDYLEFIDPILEKEEIVERSFYLSGSRYYLGCNGENCSKAISIDDSKALTLEMEPDNSYDRNAVKVLTGTEVIGYIPRYYSGMVRKMLEEHYNYSCEVIGKTKKINCSECIKVRLKIWK